MNEASSFYLVGYNFAASAICFSAAFLSFRIRLLMARSALIFSGFLCKLSFKASIIDGLLAAGMLEFALMNGVNVEAKFALLLYGLSPTFSTGALLISPGVMVKHESSFSGLIVL